MNILIISAHPDDETIGMGGTILKLKRQGHKLYWLIMTRAYSPKWREEIVSKKLKEIKKIEEFYDVEKVFHAEFKAASLATYPQHELVDEISSVISQTKPFRIYIPPLVDVHQDHEIVATAALVASKTSNAFFVENIYSYEIPVTAKVTSIKNNAQKFNCFVNVNDYFEKKIKAMKFYKSELKKLPHARSTEGLRVLARERGLHSGFKFAECFCLVFAKEK